MKQEAFPQLEWRLETGIVPYAQALEEMETRVMALAEGRGRECVWLLEHPSFYSLGTSGKAHHIHANPQKIPVIQTGRGGQLTYHGPGQRVGYVMLNLKARQLSPRAFVQGLERWIGSVLERLGVPSFTDPRRIGVWTWTPTGQEAKIAAIGVRIRRGISFHGWALNVAPDLSFFQTITPCGLSGYGVTSLEQLGITVDRSTLDALFQESFEAVFGLPSL